MTDKELRKLKRIELLELLVEQAEEMEKLREQLREAQEALEVRTLEVREAGTLSEAVLRLSGVFTAADRAAKDYVDSLRAMHEHRDAKLAEAREEAERLCEDWLVGQDRCYRS